MALSNLEQQFLQEITGCIWGNSVEKVEAAQRCAALAENYAQALEDLVEGLECEVPYGSKVNHSPFLETKIKEAKKLLKQ